MICASACGFCKEACERKAIEKEALEKNRLQKWIIVICYTIVRDGGLFGYSSSKL